MQPSLTPVARSGVTRVTFGGAKIKAALVAALLICASAAVPASADVIFSDDFNSYNNPGATNTQSGTGLTVGARGLLSNWNGSGRNAVHAVDRSGNGDWAAMLFGGSASYGPADSISLKSLVTANTLGTDYTVSFDGAAATYNDAIQGNTAGDAVNFQVLRSDGTVLSSYTYSPAAWADTSTNPFTPGSFTYTGDGTGNVGLSIRAVTAGDGHFGGAIDNLSLATVPEPSTCMLMLSGLALMGGMLRRGRVRSPTSMEA